MYYDPKITRNELLKRFRRFDDELFLYALENDIQGIRLRIEIVGSSCLLLNEINIPATEDIDIVRMDRYVDPSILYKYDMNTRAAGIENYLPYNYRDRMIKFNMETKIVDFYYLSLEEVIVAKIVAAREKDDDHLKAKNIAEKIHWPTLKICMEEIKLSLLNEKDYSWMVNRYNEFVRRNGHEEVIIKDI